MKNTTKILTAFLIALALSGIVTSCEKGPAEKAGEKIDNAVQDTKDAVHDAKNDITKKK